MKATPRLQLVRLIREKEPAPNDYMYITSIGAGCAQNGQWRWYSWRLEKLCIGALKKIYQRLYGA